MKSTTRYGLAALLLAGSGLAGAARADEGMWTLDNLPKQLMQQRYGFTPDGQWIDRVMHASLRMASGCSASFVSPDGLVMTNHHCVASCLGDLQKTGQNYVRDGFAAPRAGAEPHCPGMELDQLQQITDVTARIDDATKNKSGSDFISAEHAAESVIEKECGSGDPRTIRCDVIALYHGGRYDLYKYRRYDDVRLAFAPEDAVANFGGDPDNFNFPTWRSCARTWATTRRAPTTSRSTRPVPRRARWCSPPATQAAPRATRPPTSSSSFMTSSCR